MKSKLSAVLVAAGSVLAASPANAISFTIDPGITSSVPGTVLFDDFDLVQNTAIGTITGGILNMGSAACVCASGGNFIGTGGGQDAITVMFTNPVSYVGFTWGTPDRANTVDVYNASRFILWQPAFDPNHRLFQPLCGLGAGDHSAGLERSI
jgi:hypothetical protein